jgi:hypothetical protein
VEGLPRLDGCDRYKTMTLATPEFIRRFLSHVLPDGFHRIRHYGLLASGTRFASIASVDAAQSPRGANPLITAVVIVARVIVVIPRQIAVVAKAVAAKRAAATETAAATATTAMEAAASETATTKTAAAEAVAAATESATSTTMKAPAATESAASKSAMATATAKAATAVTTTTTATVRGSRQSRHRNCDRQGHQDAHHDMFHLTLLGS